MTALKKMLAQLLYFAACFTATHNVNAQVCAGSWSTQRPITEECVSGQWVGQISGNPAGCPVNPTYTSLQANTFTFASPVSTFFIDFIGFDGAVQCARMEIKVNGVFYPLTTANLSDFPPGSTCIESFSTISVTPDGYLTLSNTQTSQGRIMITNVNASNVTVSTNDANGTSFSNPFGCTTIPLDLIFFSGNAANNCKALLRWKSGVELNVKNIELLRSTNGAIFNKVITVPPKGADSYYTVETDNREDAFFRLKINDIDGQYKYSEIVKVKSKCSNTTYKINPNPISSLMEITGLQKEDIVSVKNTIGQTILIFNSLQNDNKFNLQGLAAGVYFVQICSVNGYKTSLKIIKN